MPGKDGLDILNEVLVLNPTVELILISGRARDFRGWEVPCPTSIDGVPCMSCASPSASTSCANCWAR